MFTIKTTKEGIEIDSTNPHSTMEIHFFKDYADVKEGIECNSCKKKLKNGDCAGFVSVNGKMVIEHEVCKSD